MKKVEKLLTLIDETDYKLGNLKFPVVRAFVYADEKVFHFILICYNSQIKKYGVILTYSSKHRNTIFDFGSLTNVLASNDYNVSLKKYNELIRTKKGFEIDATKVYKKNYVDDLYNKLTKIGI